MRMIQAQLDPDALDGIGQTKIAESDGNNDATVQQLLGVLESTALDPPPIRASSEWTSSSSVAQESNTADTQPAVPAIREPGARRITVWFNAWKYESTAQVWAGLADCIVQQIGERMKPVQRELFWFRLQKRRFDGAKIRRKIYEEMFAAFGGAILRWAPAYLAGSVFLVISALLGHWKSAEGVFFLGFVGSWAQALLAKHKTKTEPARVSLGEFVRAPDYAASLGFIHEVVEDLRQVFSLIPKKDLPMVVFIDDLDRCSPGKVADVVEAINLFLAGEFPDCMFIMGIDDEMVAAALDRAHSDVIAKLPRYAKSTSIGWRFMDKFVQLPFVIPPAAEEDLTRYVESLMSRDGLQADVGMRARDLAARVVEQNSTASKTPRQIVREVSGKESLEPGQQESLERDVRTIQDMNEDIKKFTDQQKDLSDTICHYAKLYFDNPRDAKRFVNLFRFYYFLQAARQARGQHVSSLDQLCRWLAFSLKWPEVVRWVRYQISQDGSSDSPFVALEELGGASSDLVAWQNAMDKSFGLNLEQVSWLNDRELYEFLKNEASEFKPVDRLSSCFGKGLW
jgi:hypothetical protein